MPTIHLKFAAAAEAEAAFAARGMTLGLDSGRLAGVRWDVRLLGGDGVHRRQTGTRTIEDPEIGTVEEPIFETVPGFHVDLLWSGDVPPDFGDAVIAPTTPSHVFST